MKEYLYSLFKNRFGCTHSKALIENNEGYCPECGVYLKKYFYIVRCKCCDIKRGGQLHFGKIMPAEKFCVNCGAQEFYIEKFEKINFTDIKFAIHQKQVQLQGETKRGTQLWVEPAETKSAKQLHLKLIQRIEESA